VEISLNLTEKQLSLLKEYRTALAAENETCCNKGCTGCNPRVVRTRAFVAQVPQSLLQEVLEEDTVRKLILDANRRKAELMAEVERELEKSPPEPPVKEAP
jgi:hypothetical protein